MLAGWQDFSIYNIRISARRKFYMMLMANVDHHERIVILHHLSSPIVIYETRHYRGGDACFNERFKRLLDKESM